MFIAACSSVTAKSSRSYYIVSMPTNLYRYYVSGYSHFINTSCYQRRPLLDTSQSPDLFLKVLEQIRQRHQFVVVGYVVMPERVHLLFSEPERGNLSLVLASTAPCDIQPCHPQKIASSWSKHRRQIERHEECT
jgi:hypothetical protein